MKGIFLNNKTKQFSSKLTTFQAFRKRRNEKHGKIVQKGIRKKNGIWAKI